MSTSSDHIRVSVLYPDHLNIYADRGNLSFLQKRCEWRGIELELQSVGFGDRLDPEACDLIYLGGGQDRDQSLCARDLKGEKAATLRDWFSAGRPLLAVCGGYQLLGSYYASSTERIEGAGAAPLHTEAGNERLIGAIAIQTELGGPAGGVLAGFENHAGRTVLGSDAQALGRVLKGYGNDGESGLEGVLNGHSIGTYLHGPLLPKNWWLADWMIAGALGREASELAPLDEQFERLAHQAAANAAGLSG